MAHCGFIAWNGKEEKAASASAVRRDIFVAKRWKVIEAPLPISGSLLDYFIL
jgi:hypothetical protein